MLMNILNLKSKQIMSCLFKISQFYTFFISKKSNYFSSKRGLINEYLAKIVQHKALIAFPLRMGISQG
jgi:hypothetical protein